MGLLNKTKCTVIGPMQYADGGPIREFFSNELNKFGIVVYDHFRKPFIDKSVDETNGLTLKFKEWISNGQLDEVAKYRNIRAYDLSLVERSDFIIFHFIPGVVTVGSWEEFFLANSIKRPIFFITEGGKQHTPVWVTWTIPSKYIYNSKEEVVEMIKKIDNKEIIIDSNRWRLFREDFR